MSINWMWRGKEQQGRRGSERGNDREMVGIEERETKAKETGEEERNEKV